LLNNNIIGRGDNRSNRLDEESGESGGSSSDTNSMHVENYSEHE
jgi:hypothetical protein